MIRRSRFTAFALGVLGCGGAHHGSVKPAAPTIAVVAAVAEAPAARPDPDLNRPPPRRLLELEWEKIVLTDDAAALALWRRIAPTGADWDDKLTEIPARLARPLAIALLHGGNFTCARPATGVCARPAYDVPSPAESAGLDDPCLRRLLALWSIDQLDESDVPAVKPALLGIAAIPPPESQLIEAAIHAIPERDHDARLEVLATAWRAGQHDLVDAAVGALDEAHLVTAATRHHIAGALDALTAEGQRAVYLAAVNDEALPAPSRTSAIDELAAQGDRLAPDVQAALRTAVTSKDCSVAAAAARTLEHHGDRRFVPVRPRSNDVARLMRSLCVLASYQTLQRNDEPSPLTSYLPARGLERLTITYDALSESDDDGDGDPHTTHTAELLAPGDAVLPQIDDLVGAMQHCSGTICVSTDYEYRFVWKMAGGAMRLWRIELADRPPCTERNAAKP